MTDFKKKLKCALESDVARYLIKCVTERGGIIRKVSWEGRANAPDYLVMLNGISVFVETKAPGEKPRPLQVREFEKLKQYGGFRVAVCDGPDTVDGLMYWFAFRRNLSNVDFWGFV